MASAKKGPGIELVFGAGPKGPKDEDATEARSILKEASGWDDATLDALHEYIMSCTSGGDMPTDDEAPSSVKEGY